MIGILAVEVCWHGGTGWDQVTAGPVTASTGNCCVKRAPCHQLCLPVSCALPFLCPLAADYEEMLQPVPPASLLLVLSAGTSASHCLYLVKGLIIF